MEFSCGFWLMKVFFCQATLPFPNLIILNSMHKTQVYADAHHLVLHTDVAAWLRKQEISGDKSSS